MKIVEKEVGVDVSLSSALRSWSTMPQTVLGRVAVIKPTVLGPAQGLSPTSSSSSASCSCLCRESGDNSQTLRKKKVFIIRKLEGTSYHFYTILVTLLFKWMDNNVQFLLCGHWFKKCWLLFFHSVLGAEGTCTLSWFPLLQNHVKRG